MLRGGFRCSTDERSQSRVLWHDARTGCYLGDLRHLTFDGVGTDRTLLLLGEQVGKEVATVVQRQGSSVATVDQNAEVEHGGTGSGSDGDHHQDARQPALRDWNVVKVARSDGDPTPKPVGEINRVELLGLAWALCQQLLRSGDVPAELRVRTGHREGVDLTAVDRQAADETAAEAF